MFRKLSVIAVLSVFAASVAHAQVGNDDRVFDQDIPDQSPARESGGPTAISEDNVGRALSEAINNALVVGQTVLLADAPGPLLTTYATEKALWTVYVEKPNAATGIEARPVGKTTLHKLITKLITTS